MLDSPSAALAHLVSIIALAYNEARSADTAFESLHSRAMMRVPA